MSFATAINCMDGRAQLPVFHYMKDHFNVDHVDMITEPGANGVLSSRQDPVKLESIIARVNISLDVHKSVGIGVVGHHDCAGNPVSDAQQNTDTLAAVEYIRSRCPKIPVIGLWVDADGKASQLPEAAEGTNGHDVS